MQRSKEEPNFEVDPSKPIELSTEKPVLSPEQEQEQKVRRAEIRNKEIGARVKTIMEALTGEENEPELADAYATIVDEQTLRLAEQIKEKILEEDRTGSFREGLKKLKVTTDFDPQKAFSDEMARTIKERLIFQRAQEKLMKQEFNEKSQSKFISGVERATRNIFDRLSEIRKTKRPPQKGGRRDSPEARA